LIARPSQRLERTAEQALRFPFRVHVRRVDEVHASVERGSDHALDLGLSQAAHDLPKALASEGHGSEAELGHEHTSFSETVVTHGFSPGRKQTTI
jgi:hypothetical protein